jgi:hypothetical protein
MLTNQVNKKDENQDKISCKKDDMSIKENKDISSIEYDIDKKMTLQMKNIS